MSTPSLVPATDRAPSLASRVVTIHATDVTEGAPAPDSFTFSLPCALRVPADDVILRPGGVKVRLVDGRAQVRLPVYSEQVQTVEGSSDWVVLVTPSWGRGEPYPIRVPAGSGAISLADLPSVRPLTRREREYAVTGVGVTVTEGAQAGGSASYVNGQLDLKIQVPSFRPQTVYPYIDETADARAEHYEQRVRADLDARLEGVTTAYDLAVADGYSGTLTQWLASLRGPKGDKGADSTVPGPANVLTIGTVTTGDAGSQASATISGTSPAQVLGLTIPRGDKGDKGDKGDTGSVDSVPWSAILDKPISFPPGTHTHTQEQVDGLVADLGALSGRLDALEATPEWVDLTYPAGVKHAGSGSPLQYKIDGDQVLLRGRVSPTDGVFSAGTGYVLATLPPEARPAYTQRTVFAGGSTTQWGRLEVSYSSGQVNIAPISGDMVWADLSQTSWTLD